VTSVTPCNLCGLTCALPTGPADATVLDDHGLIACEVMGHYASTPGNGHGALDDGDAYTFSLCEFCLDWLFTQFRIPPKVEAVSLGTCDIDGNPVVHPRRHVEWRPASLRVSRDEWRHGQRFKGHDAFYAEAARRDLARGLKERE